MILPHNLEKNFPILDARSRTIDQATFTEIFDQYKNLVFKTAFLMQGDEAEAEEALQEVFIRVYRSLESYRPEKGAITTWLHRITINYCLEKRRKHRFLFIAFDDGPKELVDASARLTNELLDEKEIVKQAMRRLSLKLRAVIILRYFWDLPYAEIATILHIPLGTVKSRIDRALRNLREELKDPETGRQGDAGTR